MKDNLSLVITIIVLVLLMIIFPLYNNFERQDNMSSNVVLKATTVFVDNVLNSGYIDQKMYEEFVTELANTGNIYDIELEAHKKTFTNDPNNPNIKIEQFIIDYNDDIFEDFVVASSNLNAKSLKNDVYQFNEGDKFYVRVKNSNTTMAGAIFSAIVPSSAKTRISANYGGAIKNVAWKKVNAEFKGFDIGAYKPTLKIVNIKGGGNVKLDDKDNKNIDLLGSSYFLAESFSYGLEGETREIFSFNFEITNLAKSEISNITKYALGSNQAQLWLSDYDFSNGQYEIKVTAKDSVGVVSPPIVVKVICSTAYEVIVNSKADGNLPGGNTNISPSSPIKTGETVTISVEPNDGYEFTGWTNENNETKDTLSFEIVVNEPVTWTANFKKIKYKIEDVVKMLIEVQLRQPFYCISKEQPEENLTYISQCDDQKIDENNAILSVYNNNLINVSTISSKYYPIADIQMYIQVKDDKGGIHEYDKYKANDFDFKINANYQMYDGSSDGWYVYRHFFLSEQTRYGYNNFLNYEYTIEDGNELKGELGSGLKFGSYSATQLLVDKITGIDNNNKSIDFPIEIVQVTSKHQNVNP